MTSNTKWVAGAGAGLTWTSAFSTECSTLANANAVLSSIAVTNGTALDQLMDISLQATISSSTIAAGANFAFWLFPLLADGTTYSEILTTTPAAVTPGAFVYGTIPLYAAASRTALSGALVGMILPPGSFTLGVQNNCGFTLTACTIKYRTYNVNLNG